MENMGSSERKYRTAAIMTGLSIPVFLATAGLSVMAPAIGGKNGDLTFPKMLDMVKDSFHAVGTGGSLGSMAAIGNLVSAALLLLASCLLAGSLVIQLIISIQDLANKKCDIVTLCRRVVREGGFWLFSLGMVYFHELSGNGFFSFYYKVIGAVLFIFVFVLMEVSIVSDLRVGKTQILSGRLLAFLLFLCSIGAVCSMKLDAVHVFINDGKANSLYAQAYEGDASLVGMPQKAQAYLESMSENVENLEEFSEDDMDMVKQARSEISAAKYGTAIGIMTAGMIVMLVCFIQSALNFVNGFCFRKYSLISQIIYSVLAIAASCIVTGVYYTMILQKEYTERVVGLNGFYLVVCLSVFFIVGSIVKNSIDKEYVYRERMLGNIQGEEIDKVVPEHYKKMMGDKPVNDGGIDDYEEPHGSGRKLYDGTSD